MPPKKLPPKAPSKKLPSKAPSKKLPPKRPQQESDQKPPQKPSSQSASGEKSNGMYTSTTSVPDIPEHEVKQSSSASAQLALEAGKKAYELRQAAYGAADPTAREEVLAKAINKEIEAESFGKAAKYTRSGAFQGLAAGAGLGVQPGVTLGKLTGALVGGLISSAGALLGGGVGSVYGAISGPFWDLGQMASQGVRSIVGDFPNWEATSSQKKALNKMVLGAQQTKAPTQEELEHMSRDDGGGGSEDYKRFASDLTSWLPSMPSMPSMPSVPAMSSILGQEEQSNLNTSSATANTTPKPAASTLNKQLGTSESQRPKSVGENALRNKPKKLEVRSKNTTLPQTQAPIREAPPKLKTRRSTVTAK